LEGTVNSWYRNGKVMWDGEYKNGKFTGRKITYDSDGKAHVSH
jgi:antitoxin component YwqK of YwqJK toxin-antitoxin module